MAPNIVPSALSTPWSQKAKLTSTNTTVAATIATAGYTNSQANPSKVFAVIVCNNDTISHDVQLGILDPTLGFIPMGTGTIPINAGYVGTVPAVNLLSLIGGLPLDETGQPYFFMQPTGTLQAKALVAIGAGKEVDFITQGADF